MRISDAFDFPDPESPIINIFMDNQGFVANWCSVLLCFLFVTQSNLIIFALIYNIVTFSFFFFTY